MFSGIVQAVVEGELKGSVLKIPKVWDVSVGESVAVNGVCLTVSKVDERYMYFDVGPETLEKTNLAKERFFNLERALRVGDPVGGHYVTGHVDGTVKLLTKRRAGNFVFMTFSMPKERWAIAKKGSIALNGVSLTVADLSLDTFTVQFIPHTLERTNFKFAEPGAEVNYEIDIFARYLERLVRVWMTSLRPSDPSF